MFIGFYNKSVVITYLGIVSAIIGYNFALNNNINLAMICLVTAGICDLFDGKIARMCKRNKSEIEFGIQIDSLADMVGFVVFPCVIGLGLGLNSWYHILGYILLIIAGITRLGFFNINTNGNTPVKYYSGLPVTSTSIIIPLFHLILNNFDSNTYNLTYIIMIYLISFLFIANIKIPKFKGIAYPIVATIGVIGIILLIIFGV